MIEHILLTSCEESNFHLGLALLALDKLSYAGAVNLSAASLSVLNVALPISEVTPSDDSIAISRAFRAALISHKISIPSMEQASLQIAQLLALKIASGALSPYDGARVIWRVGCSYEGFPDELAIFVGAASEIEDLPERYADSDVVVGRYVAELNAEIVAESFKLLLRRHRVIVVDLEIFCNYWIVSEFFAFVVVNSASDRAALLSRITSLIRLGCRGFCIAGLEASSAAPIVQTVLGENYSGNIELSFNASVEPAFKAFLADQKGGIRAQVVFAKGEVSIESQLLRSIIRSL